MEIVKDIKQNIKNKKSKNIIGLIDIIAQSVIFILLAISLAVESSVMTMIIVVLALAYVSMADNEASFYFIVGLSIYQNSFTIKGDNAIFLVLIVFLIKHLIFNKTSFKNKIILIAASLVIIVIELLNDRTAASKGELLVTMFYILFFLYSIICIEDIKFDINKFLIYFFIAYFSATAYVFYESGNVFQYFKNFFIKPEYYRFGYCVPDEIGGPMAIPIYSLTIVSFSIVNLLFKNWKGVLFTILSIIFVTYATFIGFLTISRSFILGLLVILLVGLIYTAITKRWRIISLVVYGVLCFGIIYLIFPNFMEAIIRAFINRSTGDTTGSGRTLIWQRCFVALTESVGRFLFGGGAINYVNWNNFDYNNNLVAGAHNLFIDVVMSWGLIGFICFFGILTMVLVRNIKKNGFVSLYCYLPLIAFFAFGLTALRTNSLRTYAFLLVSIACVFTLSKRRKSMEPKLIHYCWFGGNPLPKYLKKYINSWKQYCPNAKIVEWNESNFDVNSCKYSKEAYENKKWAFVSDYARFVILNEHGGIYLDTDVELIKNIDNLPETFVGFESDGRVNSGLIRAAKAGDVICEEMIKSYKNDSFVLENGELNLKTVCERETEVLKNYGLELNGKMQTVANTAVYPVEYFSPLNVETMELCVTPNTYAIHHFKGSWLPKDRKFVLFMQKVFGHKFVSLCVKIKGLFKKK